LNDDVEQQLVAWVRAERAAERPVSRRLIVVRMLQLQEELRGMSWSALSSLTTRFMIRHDFVVRRITSTTAAGAVGRLRDDSTRTFLRSFADEKRSYPLSRIVNMDETPVWFVMVDSHVVEQRGSRDARVAVPPGSKKRVPVVLSVAADGQKLPPFLIFQAKKDGELARKYKADRDGYPVGVSVAYQESAWMDCDGMHVWLESVVKPFIKSELERYGTVFISYIQLMCISSLQERRDMGAAGYAIRAAAHTQPVRYRLEKQI